MQKRPSRIGILIHTRPDPDTVSAALIARDFFTRFHIEATLISADPLPNVCQRLAAPLIFENELKSKNYHLILALDIGGLEKTGFATELSATAVPIYSIDHHEPSQEFARHICRDQSVSSTCEILYQLLLEMGSPLSLKVARWLLAGITTDTEYFRHASTSESTLRTVARLMELGAHPAALRPLFTNQISLATLKIWGKALANIQVETINEHTSAWAAISSTDLEDATAPPEELHLSSLAYLLNAIDHADFSLILSQTDSNLVKVSLRSDEHKEHRVNVAEIARRFGGGGHRYASGFTIPGKLIRAGDSWKIIK